MEPMNFCARAHDLILKVARTLADLAGKQDIGGNEVLEAIQFRSLDRHLFEQALDPDCFPARYARMSPASAISSP